MNTEPTELPASAILDGIAFTLLRRVQVAVNMRHSTVDQDILNYERFMNAYRQHFEIEKHIKP